MRAGNAQASRGTWGGGVSEWGWLVAEVKRAGRAVAQIAQDNRAQRQ
jgi:hypothetical protein